MKYTIENYEEHALDYLEGTMSLHDREEFESFLNLHPEISQELQSIQLFSLPAFAPAMPNRESLLRKKPDSSIIRIRAYRIRSIAAAILILIFAIPLGYDLLTKEEHKLEIASQDTGPEHSAARDDFANSPVDTLPEKNDIEKIASVGPIKEIKGEVEKPSSKKPVLNISKQNDIPKWDESMFDDVDDGLEIKNPSQQPRAQYILASIESIEFNLNITSTPIRDARSIDFIDIEPKNEESDFNLRRLLAKVNLMPSSFDGLSGTSIKEKILPEAFGADE